MLNQPPYTISKLYADDLKCYNEIINKTDSKLFADTLDHINEWSLSWQLPVAAHKCQIMRISNKNSSGDDLCQFRLGTYMLSEIDKTEVWSSSTAGDILLLEKVQKSFTKKLLG